MIKKSEAGQSPLPVYFYCTRSAAEPERSKPNAVFASILRQLTCSHPDAPFLTPVIEMYKSRGEGFNSNGLDLDDSRDLIINLTENYGMTIIIVDALDESDPQLRQSLLDAFEYVLKESAGLVKIFVSSRNDRDIVDTLREYPNLDISSDRNTADIEKYVKSETHSLVKKRQLLRNSSAKEEMAGLIIERLSSGADGMFRWVSLQLDVLRAFKRDEDIRARLGKLPRELKQLYLEVYNNLIADQDEIGRSIINNTLKWLLCAKEEMSASVFLHAVAANLNTDGDISIDSLLDLCNNLVVYDESLNVFRFAHLSVREFLEQNQGFGELSCDIVAAECCLLQMIASSKCPTTEHLMSDKQLLRLRRSPDFAKSSSRATFTEYAGNYWTDYSRQIPSEAISDSKSLGRILWFFFLEDTGSHSPLRRWAQRHCDHVLSYRASEASMKLQTLLTSYPDHPSTAFLVASYCGFTNILRSYLKDARLNEERKCQGLLLALMNAQYTVFDILVEDKSTLTVTEPLLIHAVNLLDKGRIELLLDQAPETILTDRVFSAILEKLNDWDDEKVIMLMNRCPGLTIGVRALEAAVRRARPKTFRLLVARVAEPSLTEAMLQFKRPGSELEEREYIENIEILLNITRESSLLPDLIASAAGLGDKRFLEMMLEKAPAGNITENVMIRALQSGIEFSNLTLKHGGKITDAMLDRVALYCGVKEWQTLVEQAHKPIIDVKRLRLAVENWRDDYGVLNLLLDHAEESMLINCAAELICYTARNCQHDQSLRVLLNRTKNVEISQDMLWAATLNSHMGRLGCVQMLMERSSQLQITADMLIIAACHGHDGFDLFKLFLEQECEVEMSEYVLLAAASNWQDGDQIMRFLLEHERAARWKSCWTGDVLAYAARNLSPDLVLDILERSGTEVTTQVLKAAASNSRHGDKLMGLLLARANLHVLPDDDLADLLVEAVATPRCGIQMIHILEERFGRIDMTESLMEKCVNRATTNAIEFLLGRTTPGLMTHKVLISAIKNGDLDVGFRIAEKSLHIPITIEILESAAEYGNTDLFRFLWNRSRRSSVPEDVLNAAARNKSYMSVRRFLLEEADLVEISEKTLTTILSCRIEWITCDTLDMLLGQGLQADTTEDAAKTLLINGGIRVKCSLPTKLQLREGSKVTEDIFRIAASVGNERFLEKLTYFCKLGNTPEEWLDIARLRNAVGSDDRDKLKSLLARGVDPDVADPYGETPLFLAAILGLEVAAQMLLSAGALPDGGPDCKNSPLCRAAKFGRYEVVQILLDAGASIDFVNDQGKTPAMIAKERGRILVLKYLDQHKLKQERVAREPSES